MLSKGKISKHTEPMHSPDGKDKADVSSRSHVQTSKVAMVARLSQTLFLN
jgi:hypothetical protein